METMGRTDMPKTSWLDRLPASWLPYARLMRADRPIGTWLLLLPCWWSLSLASPGFPDLWMALLFGVGALVMRGAGCTVNDIADRDFDARVARTALRPIASGAVSLRAAFVFLAAQLLVGLAILLQFNGLTIAVGAGSLVLVALYPFAKRVTYWPQAVLGLTFNWGALVGWTAVTGSLDLPPVLFYVAGLFWTLGYDTIYAHQDKEDDVMVGVKSTALKFGDRTPIWLAGFYVLALVLMGAGGWLAGLGWAFWAGLALGGLHLARQVITVDINDAAGCLATFKSNRDFGLIVTAAIIAGHLI
ncbi:MAG: 4-hydroxybenzoate octaprenyltransferase [Rhodospirillales bacterium]